MIVVADAGPLIHLAAIGHLELLRQLAAEVMVPEAVFHEVVTAGAGLFGAAEVASAEWITVIPPVRLEVVDALTAGGLHLGESQAIALALERRADLLVIDERQGRLTAEAMGVRIVGTVGVLIAARERGDVPTVAPLLTALQDSGLWLSQALIDRVLAAVGEHPG